MNHAIPFEPSPNESTTATVATSIDDDDLEVIAGASSFNVLPTRSSTRLQMNEASTSKPKSSSRNLKFTVHCKDHLILTYNLPDTSTVCKYSGSFNF